MENCMDINVHGHLVFSYGWFCSAAQREVEPLLFCMHDYLHMETIYLYLCKVFYVAILPYYF